MNSATLVTSLIIAGLLALLIAFIIQLMMRGWRGRAGRQAELIGTLPPIPETVGSPIVAPTRGVYVGCTIAPSWHERVAVGDLGYRPPVWGRGGRETVKGARTRTRESWRSGGGCRRAPKSISGFAVTTAASTPAGYRRAPDEPRRRRCRAKR